MQNVLKLQLLAPALRSPVVDTLPPSPDTLARATLVSWSILTQIREQLTGALDLMCGLAKVLQLYCTGLWGGGGGGPFHISFSDYKSRRTYDLRLFCQLLR